MDSLKSEQVVDRKTIVLYDVSDCVKSWGRPGILGGGLFGFVLGAALVAIPNTANVLTFGVIGTLTVGMVEGAVIAGAFATCAAALYSKGTLRGKVPAARRPAQSGWRERGIPTLDWPARWAFPTPIASHHLKETYHGK